MILKYAPIFLLFAGCGLLSRAPENLRDACADLRTALDGTTPAVSAQDLVCDQLSGDKRDACERANRFQSEAVKGLRALYSTYCED